MGISAAGSVREPLSAEQRRRKPPVSHPIFLVHPDTGRKVLYADPGYSVCINELPPKESAAILCELFDHQLRPEYRFVFDWAQGDVVMSDGIGTIHQAIADYRAGEPRLMKRCQILMSTS